MILLYTYFNIFAEQYFDGRGTSIVTFEIKEIQAEDTFPLRKRVLWPERSLDEVQYDTDFLEGSFHLGAFFDQQLISVASFLRESHPNFDDVYQYRLNGMVTLPDFQGEGAGSRLLVAGEKKLKGTFAQLLWCYARDPVSRYYTRFGLREYGEDFVSDLIGPHKLLYKKL